MLVLGPHTRLGACFLRSPHLRRHVRGGGGGGGGGGGAPAAWRPASRAQNVPGVSGLSSSTALYVSTRTFASQDDRPAPHGESTAAPPPPPRAPEPHRTLAAADAQEHEGEEEEDALDALLRHSLNDSAAVTGNENQSGPWNDPDDDAEAGQQSYVNPSSATLFTADAETSPQDVEQDLEATLSHEEALDYIEAIDGMDQFHALMSDVNPGEADGDDDAALLAETALGQHSSQVASLFWWHHDGQLVSPSSPGAEAAPLQIPDASGHVAGVAATEKTTATTATEAGPGTALYIPGARMMDGTSALHQADLQYLSYPARPEARIPVPEPDTAKSERRCVLVVYAANDLRVHDHYPLALASARAQALGLPVVAVCVLDYRTFAQPSLVGGFFRQSPQRAQFLLDTVAALRDKLEETHHVPLLVRCGRPEEHVPRLAVELGATDVYLTTQYAPHERRVHDDMIRAMKQGTWHSRQAVLPQRSAINDKDENSDHAAAAVVVVPVEEVRDVDGGAGAALDKDALLFVHAHPHGGSHPYTAAGVAATRATPHSVWHTTLVHLDDLPTPVAAMKEGERWYHDDVTVAAIRPTAPYNEQIARLRTLPTWSSLLPTEAEKLGAEPVPVPRGALPTLEELGYGDVTRAERALRAFAFEEVIATQSSHPTPGEDAAQARVQAWLTGNDGSSGSGMTSMLRLGRERRTNTKMYSEKLARVSPYLSCGALSPRAYYEALRAYTHEHLRDGFVQMQYREALLRLSRRDYWHWMGLRYGARLFYSYGPRPEDTDGVPDWRADDKIVQKWCLGLTGIPFADAAMRELLGTGFVAHEGRQALMWLLATGLGQDWRLGAEWLERCSLDYDPFICYGNAAYNAQLIPDDYGEPVRGVHYLAHQHDQTGIYIKKWLPQLSKVPPVYIHRPYVMTPRMQAMHGVYLGKNYPYPIKLWHGAQTSSLSLRGDVLTAVYPNGIVRGPGVGEAARHGAAVMEPEEWNVAVSHKTTDAMASRPWARAYLPEEILNASEVPQLDAGVAESELEEVRLAHVASSHRGQRSSPHWRTAHVAVD